MKPHHKFRVWIVEEKIMCTPPRDTIVMNFISKNPGNFYLNCAGHLYFQVCHDSLVHSIFCPSDFYKPMLCTGRKDKNLKEVYEDDIIEIPQVWMNGKECFNVRAQVKFIGNGFCFACGGDDSLDMGLGSALTLGGLVIGNIHENAELLK